MSISDKLKEHANDCEHCQLAIETFPDLKLFDHQLCTMGQRIFRAREMSKPKWNGGRLPNAREVFGKE